MQSEMDVLKRANPVPLDKAKHWTNSEQARRSHTRLMDAVETGAISLEQGPAVRKSRSSWRAALIGAVAVAVAVALPLLVVGVGRRDVAAPPSSVSVDLGVEHVWPDGGRPGSAVQVATAFGVEALGWADVTAVPDPQANPDGPVWVRLQQAGMPELSVLTAPIPGGGRALLQVGSPPTIGLSEPGATGTSWIILQIVPNAVAADISVRLIDSEQTTVIEVGSGSLANGRFETSEVADARLIASLLVRYRNADGTVITAAGGSYAPLETIDEAITPQVILSDGVITKAEYRAAALAVVDCIRAAGIDTFVGFHATGYVSIDTFTTVETAPRIVSSCEQKHLGRIAKVWVDQNAPISGYDFLRGINTNSGNHAQGGDSGAGVHESTLMTGIVKGHTGWWGYDTYFTHAYYIETSGYLAASTVCGTSGICNN